MDFETAAPLKRPPPAPEEDDLWATDVGVYVIKKRKCGMETCMKTAQAKNSPYICIACNSQAVYASSACC